MELNSQPIGNSKKIQGGDEFETVRVMNTERQRSSLFCSQDVTRCVQVTPRRELHKFSMPHPHTHKYLYTLTKVVK